MILKALWMQNSYLWGKKTFSFSIFIRLITLREQWGPGGKFSERKLCLLLCGDLWWGNCVGFVGFCLVCGVFFLKWVVSRNAGQRGWFIANKAMFSLGILFCLLQVHPILSNKTFRRLRTQFLMFSIICLLAEILILSFTYRNFSSFFIHKTVIPVVCFRLMLSSCP